MMDDVLLGILASLTQDDHYETNKELVLAAYSRGQEVGYSKGQTTAFMEHTDEVEYARERRRL